MMWCHITIGNGAPPKNVSDILGKLQKFIDDDSKTETAATISVYNEQSAKMQRDTFKLGFTPIGQVWTTGPDTQGSITRISSYYLARKDGVVVKRLATKKT